MNNRSIKSLEFLEFFESWVFLISFVFVAGERLILQFYMTWVCISSIQKYCPKKILDLARKGTAKQNQLKCLLFTLSMTFHASNAGLVVCLNSLSSRLLILQCFWKSFFRPVFVVVKQPEPGPLFYHCYNLSPFLRFMEAQPAKCCWSSVFEPLFLT